MVKLFVSQKLANTENQTLSLTPQSQFLKTYQHTIVLYRGGALGADLENYVHSRKVSPVTVTSELKARTNEKAR